MTFLAAFILGCGAGAASMIWFCALMTSGAHSDDTARADFLEAEVIRAYARGREDGYADGVAAAVTRRGQHHA